MFGSTVRFFLFDNMRKMKIMIENYEFVGESVEENANLVIRLLIRRPECLGPALQGEGEGLMASIISGNRMSELLQVFLPKHS